MPTRFQLISASSLLASILLLRYASTWALTPSYVWTAVQLYFAQYFAVAVWRIILYPKYFSPIRHLPQPPNNSFLMGQGGRIRREPAGVPAQDWINSVPNDGLIRYLYAFNIERVLPTSPKALAEVLQQRNYDFVKPHQLRSGLGRLLGIGILLAEGSEHKAQRKSLMPAFAYRHIKDLYPVFWSKSRELVFALTQSIQKEQSGQAPASMTSVFEMGQWTSRATLDIIGVAGMGQDFHAIENPQTELSQTYRRIFKAPPYAQILAVISVLMPSWVMVNLPLKRNSEILEAAEVIKKTCRQLIKRKNEKLEKGEETGVDILSVAMKSGGFSDSNLVDQMMTFLAAGHETTASALLWAVYLLCRHPDVQSRLRDEVRTRLPALDEAADMTAADIDKLPYLHAVCNEVLRLYAPVPLTLRIAARETTILNHRIPAGTTVIISPWAVNHSKELWGPDAADFNPERWMGAGRANTGGADSNYSFLTFLHGPRSCIGSAFAKAEFACLLAALVGRFEMELANKDFVLDIQGGITTKPSDGLDVKLKIADGW
ncbi:MAG: hypothetical protein M1833_006363 [Piccolia ochrophora]|nr:MAG: hypothetical protein M1833_006363 [Piccolia ochrophora]